MLSMLAVVLLAGSYGQTRDLAPVKPKPVTDSTLSVVRRDGSDWTWSRVDPATGLDQELFRTSDAALGKLEVKIRDGAWPTAVVVVRTQRESSEEIARIVELDTSSGGSHDLPLPERVRRVFWGPDAKLVALSDGDDERTALRSTWDSGAWSAPARIPWKSLALHPEAVDGFDQADVDYDSRREPEDFVDEEHPEFCGKADVPEGGRGAFKFVTCIDAKSKQWVWEMIDGKGKRTQFHGGDLALWPR